MTHLAVGLHLRRRLKNADNMTKKVGRLQQKYNRASRYYDISIETVRILANPITHSGFIRSPVSSNAKS